MGALVLLVDDSPTIRSQIRLALQQVPEFERFIEAGDGLQAFKMMVDARPDLVVCDLVMPVFDGLKFLALRHTRADLAHIPVIMLTAEGDSNRKVEVLDRGASDYVTKPFNEKELLARVRVHYRLKVLQDELRTANARLESLAVTDGLTGLFNRRYFDTLLITEMQRTLRYKTPIAVALLDIDHFKHVNDTYGHPMGDEVLRNLSRLVASSVRTTDSVARYGGEEIAVVLTQTDEHGALEVAERLRVQISELTHTLGEHSIQKTASFGVACFDGNGDAMHPEDLVKRADQALYRAKHGGRNRVVLWTPDLQQEAEPSSVVAHL
ncbi:MAG TPA: diguanylate cyclase [Polyangiaceae bacterium]|nr:diguanylate cyclase [Polyangiaceae bacterium]